MVIERHILVLLEHKSPFRLFLLRLILQRLGGSLERSYRLLKMRLKLHLQLLKQERGFRLLKLILRLLFFELLHLLKLLDL